MSRSTTHEPDTLSAAARLRVTIPMRDGIRLAADVYTQTPGELTDAAGFC